MTLIFNGISKLEGRHRKVGVEGGGTANSRTDEQKFCTEANQGSSGALVDEGPESG